MICRSVCAHRAMATSTALPITIRPAALDRTAGISQTHRQLTRHQARGHARLRTHATRTARTLNPHGAVAPARPRRRQTLSYPVVSSPTSCCMAIGTAIMNAINPTHTLPCREGRADQGKSILISTPACASAARACPICFICCICSSQLPTRSREAALSGACTLCTTSPKRMPALADTCPASKRPRHSP